MKIRDAETVALVSMGSIRKPCLRLETAPHHIKVSRGDEGVNVYKLTVAAFKKRELTDEQVLHW